MRIERIVRLPNEVLRQALAKYEGVHPVLLRIRLVLVEGEDDDGSLGVEAVVVEQWIEPVLEEVGAEVGGGVVRVVDLRKVCSFRKEGAMGKGAYHVRRHENPLRERSVDEVIRKVVEVADAALTGHVLRDGVVDLERIVLAHVEGVVLCRCVQVVRGRVADGVSYHQYR